MQRTSFSDWHWRLPRSAHGSRRPGGLILRRLCLAPALFVGRWLRSDLCDAGLRFRPARRNSVAGGETRHHEQLRLAQLLHLLTFAALIGFGLAAKLGALYYWSMPLIAAALFYEHKTEKLDLAGINRAFFQSNAFMSAVFLRLFALDRLI